MTVNTRNYVLFENEDAFIHMNRLYNGATSIFVSIDIVKDLISGSWTPFSLFEKGTDASLHAFQACLTKDSPSWAIKTANVLHIARVSSIFALTSANMSTIKPAFLNALDVFNHATDFFANTIMLSSVVEDYSE